MNTWIKIHWYFINSKKKDRWLTAVPSYKTVDPLIFFQPAEKETAFDQGIFITVAAMHGIFTY